MKIFNFIAVMILCAGFGCGNASENLKEQESPAGISLLADCKYNLSHGWGHVFACGIREILSGTLDQKEMNLYVYGTVHQYGGLLLPFDPDGCRNLILTFRKTDRKHGPPPGFRDAHGIYWELTSAAKQE